jgi:DNA polymerase epsilon subunit 1
LLLQHAYSLVDKLGKPLELDTDGIWCCLPGSFPETFKFTTVKGKDHKMSYPGVMLNVLIAQNFTNDQYQTLRDPPEAKRYATSSEMSIEFEVDGPYKVSHPSNVHYNLRWTARRSI